jgi:hypothetical protein
MVQCKEQVSKENKQKEEDAFIAYLDRSPLYPPPKASQEKKDLIVDADRCGKCTQG